MAEPMPDQPVLDPAAILSRRFADAIARVDGAPADADPMITPSKRPDLGEFQCNAAMPLAKVLSAGGAKVNPRELASRLAHTADLADIAEPIQPADIAGPGFINIRLRTDALEALLAHLDGPALGLPTAAPARTIVVDVCGVNLAKQMHVGHLRSSVVGDAIARLFERLGHRVIRQNHVGDWGLPIAMVTAKLRAEADAGRIDLASIGLDGLDCLYKLAQAECKGVSAALRIAEKFGMGPKIQAELEAMQSEADEHLTRAKGTLVALQSGDAATRAVWQRIYDTTMAACLHTCARLRTRITADTSAGESSYRDELAPIVEDLRAKRVAEESDGALVVRLDAEGIAEPCIIRKGDGGFLYATTDVAAIRRRVEQLGAHRVIYCVDARQALHFRQVFAVARRAGYATRPGTDEPAQLDHAAFGMVLGDDGKPYKTRSGENVRLSDLLDEAIERAGRAVAEKNPDLAPDERARIAEAVGVTAIKYTDLSSDRRNDYVFSFDRMLAFEGDTGPYLLYALTRIRSVFRKAEEAGAGELGERFVLDRPQEKALALVLLRYPATMRAAAEAMEPHRLCTLLYDLAVAFSAFYDACPILHAESESVRRSRLRLADLTRRVLADGLETLGLPAVERM